MLSTHEITKAYGSRQVLKGVSIVCNRGEICGLIGLNGAGKSTLFRILLGLVRPDSGTVHLDSTMPKPIGGIIEKPALYGYLNAAENIQVFAGIQGLKLNKGQIEERLLQVGLSPDRSDPVSNFSMGMKQRLGLATALLNDPECIILDEPFSGLDPFGIRALQERVRELAEARRMAVLISSHNLTEIGGLCNRLYVINNGLITAEGPTRTLLEAASAAFVIHGTGLEQSKIIKALEGEYREGSALIRPGQRPIREILQELVSEPGVDITGCVPQMDLRALFENPATA